MTKREKVYCYICLDPCESVEIVREIPDWHYGRIGVQRHVQDGSSCCGAKTLTYAEWIKTRWLIRARRKKRNAA